ncbi:MAG: imidazole glycerol phosphate synthase subunit HisH, partial [Lentisphaerae bacterium]|nr:imidazole glycerol phosphate synthase subunit HisH [Lentisphaerota bacterium]
MIAIVDYKAGNLTSVRLAFDAIAIEAVPTADPAVLARADRIVFPGVGAAASAMANLRATGLIDTLRARIAAGVPFLGICLGTQILLDRSEEDGGVDALGVLPGTVRKFTPSDPACKIPHMGWNQVRAARPHPLLEGVPDGSDFYFVHSYYPDPADRGDVIGTTDYAGVVFASMVGRGNVAATQFHVEKSGKTGLHVLRNFARWDG